MKPFKIFSDSSCDIAEAYLNKYSITLVPFYVSFDLENYYKEIFEMPIDTFYEKLVSERIFPKTSLPSIQDYMDSFKTALDTGHDVLCLCLTSVFSGSYQSAVTAREILLEDYPDAQIMVVDSIQATVGQGVTVLQAAYMQEAGYSLTETVSRLEEIKPTSRVFFTVGTLEYLQKGGRIGKAASLAGSILNLKPMIQLKECELLPVGTVRGRRKSLDRVITMTKDHFERIGESYDNYEFITAVGTCTEEADYMKAQLEELIGRKIEHPHFQVGVTIGTNTGPDALGVCLIKKFDAR